MTSEDQTNQEEATITLKSSGTSAAVSRDAMEPTPQAPISGGMAGQAVQPQAGPREPFLVRNRWLVLGAAVVLAILIVGAAVFLLRDKSVENAGKVLNEQSAKINTTASQLLSVYTVKSLRDRFGNVEVRIGEMRDAKASLGSQIHGNKNQGLADDAAALLAANIEYLKAIKKFDNVKKLGDRSYRSALTSLKAARQEIKAKSNRLVGKNYGFPVDLRVVPNAESLKAAEEHMIEEGKR